MIVDAVVEAVQVQNVGEGGVQSQWAVVFEV